VSNYKFSARSRARLDGVHPDLVIAMEEAIRVSPIDFGIPGDGGVRTAQRQRELFLDPTVKTNADGYEAISEHQPKADGFGHAVDVYAYINGAASWQDNYLTMVAATILATSNRLLNSGVISHKIKWGGTFGSDSFNGWDKPHFQLEKE